LGCKNAESLFMSVGTGAIAVQEVLDAVQQRSIPYSPSREGEFGTKASRQLTLLVTARDRADLLRDITAILANESIYILAFNTSIDRQENIASMWIDVEIPTFHSLSRALN